MAAHAYLEQHGAVFAPPPPPPPPQFIDLLPVINPNFGFVPQQGGLIYPGFQPPLPQSNVHFHYNPPVSPPVGLAMNHSFLILMEKERSISLLQYMANERLLPSPEDEEKRRNVIKKLKQIVLTWIKKVARRRQLSKEQIAATCATILTYGSYGLGVHGSESDIDALCVGPFFATMAGDFFVRLHKMLNTRPEVTDIHCVKDAKVPLMRFKFDGISVDLPYAQLKVLSVPEKLDVLNPLFLRNIDETSWKNWSGVRANECILQLVPNLENFQSMLRCVKLWAKKRGVYGNLLGFLGGVHLAILAAFVCQMHPNASISALVAIFFKTFAFWPWPAPVMLQDGMLPLTGDAPGRRSFMPIRLPCSPYAYCHSNITRSTFHRIRTEFLRGYGMTKDLLGQDFEWGRIFDQFPYAEKYTLFIKIYLSPPGQDEFGDWVGWVKSRFRCLLVKLEEVQGFCDPNPTEYVDTDVAEPNVVFYWGLQPGRTDLSDIESVEMDFVKNINNGYQGSRGRLELSFVHASQLPKDAQFDTEGTGACWRILD